MADVRPVVARNRRDVSMWLFAAVAVVGAVLLFSVLDGQRRGAAAPTTARRTVDAVQTAPGLPPLYIPSDFGVPPPPPPPPAFFGTAPAVPIPLAAQVIAPTAPATPPAAALPVAPVSVAPVTHLAAPNSSGGDVLVFDGTASSQRLEIASDLTATTVEGVASAGDLSPRAGRARSTRLGQLASTVPQGTLIPAVLETALDSTRPGHVRALVSRDVKGFDGSRVLIPRGTRLFGEYRADLAPGQNRAFVQWLRLVRPDGVAIDLDSPAADALGRAGIEGRVDSHFLERFSSALLQSTLSVGMALAGQSIDDTPVIVALPGSNQSLTPGPAQQVQPTLHVDAGVSVTVFVARDLTFPRAETSR